MQILIILLSCFLSLTAFGAKLNLKPGLWETKMELTVDGKKYDPLAEIKKSLAKLPKAQRDQMLAGMADKGTDKVQQVCITEEMVNNPDKFKANNDARCTHKIDKQTSSLVEMSYRCKDGSHGKSKMTIISSTEYKMVSDMTGGDGKKGGMNIHGKFLSKNCPKK